MELNFPFAKLCRTTYDDLRREGGEETCEFVAVPQHLMGFVIGRKGNTIKQIQTQSGARISQSEGHHATGFMVCGSKEERTCAIELVNRKVVSATIRFCWVVCLFVCFSFFVSTLIFRGTPNLKTSGGLGPNKKYGNQLQVPKKWSVTWKNNSELAVLACFRKFRCKVTRLQIFKN